MIRCVSGLIPSLCSTERLIGVKTPSEAVDRRAENEEGRDETG